MNSEESSNFKNWEFLSYVLGHDTPCYGGSNSVEIRGLKSMAQNDSCNQQHWSFHNHVGTHIDAPRHFDEAGKTVDQYLPSFWHFKSPQLIKVDAQRDQILSFDNFNDKIQPDTDLLLIKTGFGKERSKEKYWKHNPGLAPELGEWLRETHPNVRAIGFDFISLTSFQNRALGRKAHKAFLQENLSGTPIVIIEDMDLLKLETSPKCVIVSPLRVKNSDGAPATVMAQI